MGSVKAPAADASAGRGDSDEGVFDPVEYAAVVLGLLRDAGCGMQLLVDRLLILRQGARDHDVEVDELVAAAAALEVRDPLPAQAHGLAVLCAGGHAHLRAIAFDGGDLELVAERGPRRRDAQHVDEVVALTLEARGGLWTGEGGQVA